MNKYKMKTCKIKNCVARIKARGLCTLHYGRFQRGIPSNAPLRTPVGAPAAWIETNKSFAGNECLLWPFGKAAGHGKISIKGQMFSVSRLMCEYRHGPPPTSKHQAAHLCGNGHLGCANPQHLCWKTAKENMADCVPHGTHNRGERHVASKLTSKQVINIRKEKAKSLSQLAIQYGVSKTTIFLIKKYRKWAWLTVAA